MSLNFNKDLFHIFGAGTGFRNLTAEKSSETASEATRLALRLSSETLQMQQVNTAKKDACISALENHATGANVLNTHIDKRLDTFLDDMQIATAVKEIDSYIEGIPASCININTIAGSISGAADALISTVSDTLEELDEGITDYEANDLSKSEFEALLIRVTAALTTSHTAILGMISHELSMIDGFYKKHRQMAKAFSLQALINDPCVKPLLVKLAEPELSQILVNDLGIDKLV